MGENSSLIGKEFDSESVYGLFIKDKNKIIWG